MADQDWDYALRHLTDVPDAELLPLIARADKACLERRSATHNGATLLALAAGANRGNAVHALLRRGAEVNASDAAGRMPLDAACTHEASATLIEALLEAGADVSIADNGPGFRAMVACCERHHAEGLQVLLDQGLPLDLRDEQGERPLHWVIGESWGWDEDEDQPLAWGQVRNQAQATIIDILLAAGVALEGDDWAGNSPLAKAFHQGDLEAALVLMHRGARPERCNREGIPAIQGLDRWSKDHPTVQAIRAWMTARATHQALSDTLNQPAPPSDRHRL